MKERAQVLSASKAIENFALEYAENNLNDSEMITVTKDKLGKLLDWLSYNYIFDNVRQLENKFGYRPNISRST